MLDFVPRKNNFDLSLNVPQHHQTSYHHDSYNMSDQTFHTPSFGDEDFDIPTIHPQSHQQQQHHQQHDSMQAYGQPQMIQGSSMQQSSDGLNLDTNGYQQQLYLQQEHSMQAINVSSAYGNSQSSYATMSSPRHQQHSGQQLLMLQQQQQQVQMQHMQYMHSQQQQQQQQLQQQQQMQYRSPTGGSPTTMQANNIPETNNNTTTSEDSDDSTPHSGMIAMVKREPPSPEAADVGAKNQRKTKPQKKKKKRDPNEPQKPVSAYALFFRDTQAVIKGKHPNASFGEVSKIVASMWDALDIEHKNYYKKKTEAAKKEYLKALAAYRASLVSKGAGENEQKQQTQQPQQQMQYSGYTGYSNNTASGNVTYQVYSPQHQPSSPQHQQQLAVNKKSSHHLAMQGNPQQSLMGTVMAPPHMTQQQQQHMQQQISQQQYMQVPQQQVQQVQVQQQQQQQIIHTSPPRAEFIKSEDLPIKSETLSSSSSPVNPSQVTMTGQRPSPCIHQGCPNPAISNNEWEDEYCSNECVVSHCRDVFNTWVSSNQNSQQNYSTVK
ncbi:TOX high mobility group box family member 3 isoform X1 [Mycetomoellerius zeteki]|uniref:TOX high mobility group box family member 3 isoform X1 n=1 Tax=Mycetomoellerius zeteki TaxID=64791 RepID=UPI00084EA040|nr:PREDICTED: TOX high mobility group box family member 3-like isoform X1 [Trachymyrmex zeteki]